VALEAEDRLKKQKPKAIPDRIVVIQAAVLLPAERASAFLVRPRLYISFAKVKVSRISSSKGVVGSCAGAHSWRLLRRQALNPLVLSTHRTCAFVKMWTRASRYAVNVSPLLYFDFEARARNANLCSHNKRINPIRVLPRETSFYSLPGCCFCANPSVGFVFA
jgi:hypothetical protein